MKMNNIDVKEIDNGLILENVNDFNAKHIFECGQCFRWKQEADGSYTGVAFGKVINVKSDEENKRVQLLNTNIQDFQDIWFDYFDMGRDYGEIKKRLSEDPVLKTAIKYGEGIRILKQQPWEMLISYIISANNRIPMIARSIGLLSQMYGQPINYNGETYYAFPTPEELAEAELSDIEKCRAGFRCKYIHQAIKMVLEGVIDLDHIKTLDMDDARKELLKVPGVGVKVADCIMLFSMEKYGSYPVDVWIKRVTEHFYLHEEVPMKRIHEFAREKFGDLAGFAQEYLFYYAREMKIGTGKGE
ncbi:N-glycosylase/DNA lyase [Lutispora thermophila DSM 19022]|uniref:DNA-(apurinic or apyrimidinic site) lyase n=2 Tax=Lutispora TaxID=667112 RepID=A0A1M6AV21_9FIRM|nr:N-glycosylase/DNA lyase [Lutispora thermophila DSM 19022]